MRQPPMGRSGVAAVNIGGGAQAVVSTRVARAPMVAWPASGTVPPVRDQGLSDGRDLTAADTTAPNKETAVAQAAVQIGCEPGCFRSSKAYEGASPFRGWVQSHRTTDHQWKRRSVPLRASRR